MEARAEANELEGNFASAAFYWSKLQDFVTNFGRDVPDWFPWGEQLDQKKAELGHSHARALFKCGRYQQAHGVIKHAMREWEWYVPTGDFEIAKMCCLRAELDELHGSLLKLKGALFWFQETLSFDPEHPSVEQAIQRLKKKIYFADSSNW